MKSILRFLARLSFKISLTCFCFILTLSATAQGTWSFFSTANSPLPENSVRCIAIDHLDRKWVGTDYGLAIYDNVNWTVYLPFSTGLPSASVRSIVFDSANNAWIGTLGGGVAKFDGTTWTIYDDSNSPLQDNSIRTLDIDSAGALWIGSQDGLTKFDGTNWIVYSSSNSVIQNTIASVYCSSAERVLAGSINGGLFVLLSDTIKSNFTISNGSGIPDNTQLAFDEDSIGNVWFATPANGIVAYKNVGGWFWYYMGNSLLPTNSLSDIKFNSNESALWVASVDSGIVKKTGTVYKSFTTANSLIPDNNIQCLTLDNNDVLWIGTATQGVARFEETTGFHDSETLNSVTLYYIAGTDKIRVDSSSPVVNYVLCDVSGKNILAGSPGKNYFSLDVSTLKKGVYFLKITDATHRTVCKKIIKH